MESFLSAAQVSPCSIRLQPADYLWNLRVDSRRSPQLSRPAGGFVHVPVQTHPPMPENRGWLPALLHCSMTWIGEPVNKGTRCRAGIFPRVGRVRVTSGSLPVGCNVV